ncbi:MAG: outer membrane protein assembly factor BamE [Betaproteobacteria bacterium]
MRYFLILLVVLCAGCGTALPTLKPYKLDVQQGNVVTSAMLLQLRPGMTKSQVRFIMGTPLIQDSFHGNRWDYVYQMREKGKITEQRRVILDFENELLKSVRGDVTPSISDKTSANENIGTRVINSGVKPEEKSLISKLKFWENGEDDAAKEAVAAKSKLEADESAKKAASLSQRSTTPVEKTQTKPVVPIVVAPAVVAKSSEAIVDAPLVAVPEAAVPVEVPLATPLPHYDSPSNMRFDRTLGLAPEDMEPVAKLQPAPRAGNKTAPKPKDLPPESSPSFFDRMLEKIGF